MEKERGAEKVSKSILDILSFGKINWYMWLILK